MNITREEGPPAQQLCCDIYNRAMRENAQSSHRDIDGPEWDRIWAGSVESMILVARGSSGEPLGALAAARYPSEENAWVMQLLATETKARGQGAGSALIEQIKFIGAREGRQELVCAVKAHARGAQAFYRKMRGSIDRSQRHIDEDGDPIHLVRWRLYPAPAARARAGPKP